MNWVFLIPFKFVCFDDIKGLTTGGGLGRCSVVSPTTPRSIKWQEENLATNSLKWMPRNMIRGPCEMDVK